MKKFEKPSIEVIMFRASDIVTASGSEEKANTLKVGDPINNRGIMIEVDAASIFD